MNAVLAVLNGLTLLILLYLAALTYRHLRRAAGHAHNLWAADIAIRDPELRHQAAADAPPPATWPMSDDLRTAAVLIVFVLACLAIWAVLLAPVAFLIWSN